VSAAILRQPIAEASAGALLKKLLLPDPTFEFHGSGAVNRTTAEIYIAEQFAKEYDAQISSFLPQILTMRCTEGLSAAVGLRQAGKEPLYLEHYFSEPVERLIQAGAAHKVVRSRIVEVGNLVATQRGASHLLFILVSALLQKQGTEWMVFTATRQVTQILRRLKFETVFLAEADQSKMAAEDVAAWGQYYRHQPHVVAGDLSQLPKLFANNRILKGVAEYYEQIIGDLSKQFAKGQ
jgi:hypothetical protein